MAYRFRPYDMKRRHTAVKVAIAAALIAVLYYAGIGLTGFAINPNATSSALLDQANARLVLCNTELASCQSGLNISLRRHSDCQNELANSRIEAASSRASFERTIAELSLCQGNISAYQSQIMNYQYTAKSYLSTIEKLSSDVSSCQNSLSGERASSMLCYNNMTQLQSDSNKTIAQLTANYNALARNSAAQLCCITKPGGGYYFSYYYVQGNYVYCSIIQNQTLGTLPLSCP